MVPNVLTWVEEVCYRDSGQGASPHCWPEDDCTRWGGCHKDSPRSRVWVKVESRCSEYHLCQFLAIHLHLPGEVDQMVLPYLFRFCEFRILLQFQAFICSYKIAHTVKYLLLLLFPIRVL